MVKSPESRDTDDAWDDRKTDARPALYISSLILYNAPTVLYAHDAADNRMEVLDGWNRVVAMADFVAGKVELDVASLYAGQDHSKSTVTFPMMDADAQLQVLHNIHVTVVIYARDTSPGVLLRASCWAHMIGKRLKYGEEMHMMSDAVPLIEHVLVPMDNEVVDTIAKVKGPWQAKRRQLMKAWTRIAAMVFHDNLHVEHSDEKCRQWLFDQQHAALPPPDKVEHFKQVCRKTIEVYEHWGNQAKMSEAQIAEMSPQARECCAQYKSMVGGMSVMVDVAWIFDNYGFSDKAVNAVKRMHRGMFPTSVMNDRNKSIHITRERREQLGRVFCTLFDNAPETKRLARRNGTDEHSSLPASQAADDNAVEDLVADLKAAPAKRPRLDSSDLEGASILAALTSRRFASCDADETPFA